jgi:hypothetical protein
MIIKGETKGYGKINPTMVRLLEEKKAIESKWNQEQEITTIRVVGMQEMIESLTKINGDLKKQLGGPGGGGALGMSNTSLALGNSHTSMDPHNSNATLGFGSPIAKKEVTGYGNPNVKKEMAGFGNPNVKPDTGNFFSNWGKK